MGPSSLLAIDILPDPSLAATESLVLALRVLPRVGVMPPDGSLISSSFSLCFVRLLDVNQIFLTGGWSHGSLRIRYMTFSILRSPSFYNQNFLIGGWCWRTN